MRNWFSVDTGSPLGRLVDGVTRGHLTPRGTRLVTLAAGFVLAFGFVGLLVFVQISSTPQFCGTCHIMKPYYQSWKHSKHNQIACVECHISPGITAEVRKKYEALSMVVKYFTATYGTKPWAQVDDAACLRCHQRRLLEGKEVFHDVLFDHTPHLTETRRGLHLRCTSCHSQIVQGEHLTVTVSTCAICHFMGQPPNQETGRCRLCHQVPEKVVSAEGTPFDHSQVKRLDMDCRTCHGGVVRGNGEVPKDRCLQCHNETDRLDKYNDKDLLHRKHVSEHKVDCIACHMEIQHGTPPASTRIAEAAGTCSACHGRGHSVQQSMFAGIGGRGVPRMPSAMYLAGVTCEGCHDPSLTDIPTDEFSASLHTVRASAVSCMSCHGPKYLAIFTSWEQGLNVRVSALRREIDANAGAMSATPPAAYVDARHNLALVEKGHGVHNVSFAYALLDKAHDQLNLARQAKGMGALSRPWPEIAPGSAKCVSCHAGIERKGGEFGGRKFDHGPHLTRARLECDACHRPHDQRPETEIVKFGPDGCVTCHHRPTASGALVCENCHGDVRTRTVQSFRGEFSHAAHLEQGLECKSCHDARSGDPRPNPSACRDCHVD